MLQGTAQFSNRHRSLSGGTLQTSPSQQFAFTDGQYGGNQQLGNLYSQQQQQQLFQQNRGGQLQRQLSMLFFSPFHVKLSYLTVVVFSLKLFRYNLYRPMHSRTQLLTFKTTLLMRPPILMRSFGEVSNSLIH